MEFLSNTTIGKEDCREKAQHSVDEKDGPSGK